MRVHLRRLILAGVFVIALVPLCMLAHSSWKKPKIQQVSGTFHLKKAEFQSVYESNPTDIFWDIHSGISPPQVKNKNLMPKGRTDSEDSDIFSWDPEDYKHQVEKKMSKNIRKQIIDIDVRVNNISRALSELASESEEMDSQKMAMETIRTKFNLNIQKSDLIPLNRLIPDSRPAGCSRLIYPMDLPSTSVVIPFYNEWPSVILRTVYSIMNNTPHHLLKEIILVDDGSDMGILQQRFENYLRWNFPKDVVKLIRMPSREGLIRARLNGLQYVTGEVVSFFDSHMEVNKDWLQPLLNEIMKNGKTIAMSQLDYIDHETFQYNYYEGYRTRYGFGWDMQFFETFFRPDQLKDKLDTDPLPGVLMVGAGFTVNVEYFQSIGSYDDGLKIWGGENIELAWRVWMCGGQLLHVPCSKIGHIERSQPYSFPEGRVLTEMVNYKRAVDVWLGDYRQYVYSMYHGMKDLNAGSLVERKRIKDELKCHNFTWFLDNVWPELLPYKENAMIWGQVKRKEGNLCLDNGNYIFQAPEPLHLKPCTQQIKSQGFSLTKDGRLRTTLHCVVYKADGMDLVPYIENCFLSPPLLWTYNRHQQLKVQKVKMCLQALKMGKLIFLPCEESLESQKWIFNSADLLVSMDSI